LSSSGADVAVMSGSAMSFNQIKHAVSYLKSRDVEPFDNGDYVLYAHPWVVDKLMDDPKWATWNGPNFAKETMWRGEVGRLYGARVVQSNMAYRYVYSAAPLTTASGAFNASFLIGKGAFGVTEIDGGKGGRGFEIIIKNPGPGSTNDPADLIHTVAGKMTMAAAVLNKSAGAIIITTDKVVTSAS
jgi:N4-gp56 family major capsid protein